MLLLVTKSSEGKKMSEGTKISEDKHTPIEIVTKFHLQKSNVSYAIFKADYQDLKLSRLHRKHSHILLNRGYEDFLNGKRT